jgi:hypothetical protein
MISNGRLAELIGDFFIAYVENGRPVDMALFAGRTAYDEETKRSLPGFISPLHISIAFHLWHSGILLQHARSRIKRI